ncbi:hypothetical protein T459_14963 [Capsicum annuum]|uniref:Uncharacterized protein n=1 Tax=Capsicum annuum TaxID=4072 RepID=A0A2G2ZIX1_CAPAN|nr:hypothetical protein T459_14963 [Capsicum annuum]
MWEMIKDGVKTDHIMNFAALKATTQAILKGSRNIEGKKNKEDVAVIVAGQRAHRRRPGHSIEDCRDLKREIKKMIQDKLIMVQNIDSEESFSHADMQTSGLDVNLSNWEVTPLITWKDYW